MTISFNIMPPAIIHVRKPSADRWGRARLFWVSVPHNHSPHQIPHELHHVGQFWQLTIVCAVIIAGVASQVPLISYWAVCLAGLPWALFYAKSKTFRFHAEVGAYRVSNKVQPHRTGEFVKMLRGYDTGRTLKECRAAINKA